ncbi:AAA family ATPase [Burkholderia cepacia]|uniref:AAA family ATPase n=1 Tax=Burkholderia cepacia TaxID=292 RepID=UPI00158D0F4C|nr:AAA family ATPase [Burkholderia cepacia]
MAGILVDYKTIKRTHAEYQKQHNEYNRIAMVEEIKRIFPNDKNPNLDNPKYKEILDNMPFAATIMGGLAEELGMKGKALTQERWANLSHGYCEAAHIKEGSALNKLIVDTPRGKLVQFNQTSSPIDKNTGEFKPRVYKSGKNKGEGKDNLGLELLFTLSSNTSKTLARLSTEDVTVNRRLKRIFDRVLEKQIMPKLLEDARLRLGQGGKQWEYVKNMIAVSFFHIENRETEPHYHIHFDILNVAQGYDDKFNALFGSFITKEKDMLNAIWQSEMKAELEKEFGFVFKPVYLERDKKNEFLTDEERNITSWDLGDEWVPENVKDYYSKRSEEMKIALKGKDGFIAEEIARVESRKNKAEISPSEMINTWKKEMDDMGWSIEHIKQLQDFNQVRPNTQQISDEQLIDNYSRKVYEDHIDKNGAIQGDVHTLYDDKGNSVAYRVRKELGIVDDEKLIDNFYRKHGQVSFTEGQFKAHMVKQLIGDFDKDMAFRHAERMFSEHCQQMMDKEKIEYYRDFISDSISDPNERKQKQMRWNNDLMFTTTRVLEIEKMLVQSLKDRQHEKHMTFDINDVQQKLWAFEERKTVEFGLGKDGKEPFKFTDGQREAIISSLTQPGAFINIAGRAGSGKSTLLEFIREYGESQGLEFYGCSTSAAATENLQESAKLDITKANNITQTAMMLDSGKLKWNDKTVVVIDEMGMIDLFSAQKLVEYANKVGAKIIGTGEKEQLQNIGIGSTFRVTNDNFITAKVTEINRQRDSWQREMVEDFACGRAAKSIRKLHDEGHVFIKETDEETRKQLVDDYVKDATKNSQKLIVAETNADVRAINNMVREELKLSGQLSTDPKDSVVMECKDGITREFTIGDRFMFFQNFKSNDVEKHQLKNSETGEIKSIRMSKLTGKPDAILIKKDNDKEAWIKVDSLPALTHGYASTIYKSQGQTKFNTYWMPSSMVNLHSAYVAASRHKNSCNVYLSKELESKMVDRMEDHPPTARMVQVARSMAKQKGIELDPTIESNFIDCRAFLNETYERYDDRGLDKQHHPLDSFLDLCESMSKTAYKKSTFDYEVIDGNISSAYQEIKDQRIDMLNNPEKYTYQSDTPIHQPKLVEKEEEQDNKQTVSKDDSEKHEVKEEKKFSKPTHADAYNKISDDNKQKLQDSLAQQIVEHDRKQKKEMNLSL